MHSPLQTVTGILLLALMVFCKPSLTSAVEQSKPPDSAAPINYFMEGNRYRSDGNCEKALENYRKARELRQFGVEWSFYQAVADCYVALGKYDDAIEAYSRVIESARNKALLAEMYSDRGKTYYLKASRGNELDMRHLVLALKDLKEASYNGADIADLEKAITDDEKRKPAKTIPVMTGDKITVTDRKVEVIESSGRIVTGAGDYALYTTRDTVIRDKDSVKVSPAEIRVGDILDFTYANGYYNYAENMLHISPDTITMHRSVPPEELKQNDNDRIKDERIADLEEKLDVLNLILDEMREEMQEEKEKAHEEPVAPVVQEKTKRRSKSKKHVAGKSFKKAFAAKAAPKTGEKKLDSETKEIVKKYLSELKQTPAEKSGEAAAKGKKELPAVKGEPSAKEKSAH